MYMSDQILVKVVIGYQTLFEVEYSIHCQQILLKLNKTLSEIDGRSGYLESTLNYYSRELTMERTTGYGP